MFRLAIRRAVAAAQLRLPLPSSTTVRLHSSDGSDGSDGLPVALQIIDYALHHARSQKSEESYGQALLVLEQGLANLHREDNGQDNAAGAVLLAISTVLSERGDFSNAVEKLREILDSTRSPSAIKVAAFEALTGLQLEMGQDVASSALADKCLKMVRDEQDVDGHVLIRAKAIKGLAELVHGNLESAELCFAGSEFNSLQDHKGLSGNTLLTHGEYLHVAGKFSVANDFYQKALEASSRKDFSEEPASLAACNMVSEEVSLGATCALGQVETHSGNFKDAEELLTKALTKAEEQFGSKHPKVGVVLTCLAMMFGHKAKLEHSSSLLIQEGLYRRAIELLKAPSLDSEGKTDVQVDRRDIVALARGGYAQALSVQQNRKGEGARMRGWAETMWQNRRLSLAQALDISEVSKVAVVDARISRVL